MIKVIEARYLGNFQIAVVFADGKEGAFDGNVLLRIAARYLSHCAMKTTSIGFLSTRVRCAGQMGWNFRLPAFMKLVGGLKRFKRSAAHLAPTSNVAGS